MPPRLILRFNSGQQHSVKLKLTMMGRGMVLIVVVNSVFFRGLNR